MCGKGASNERADSGRDSVDGEDETHKLATLTQRNQVTHDHLHHGIDSGTADALDCTTSYERTQIWGGACDCGTDSKYGYGEECKRSAPEDVGCLAEYRRERSRCE